MRMAETTPPVTAALRVLVVEDDAIVASGLVASLEELDCVVTWCSSVEGAVAAIDQNQQFGVAIVDYNLAGVASTPVISALIEIGIPVALCTGYEVSSLDPVVQAIPRIEKPFTRKAIRKLMYDLATEQ